MTSTTTTTAARLSGEDLLAARRVISARLVDNAEIIGDGYDDLDAFLAVRDLGRLVGAVGQVGDPLIGSARLDGTAALRPDLIGVLITAARWEDVMGEDAAEASWSDDVVGVEDARACRRARAADGRRVLSALGAERGNPSEIEEAAR